MNYLRKYVNISVNINMNKKNMLLKFRIQIEKSDIFVLWGGEKQMRLKYICNEPFGKVNFSKGKIISSI